MDGFAAMALGSDGIFETAAGGRFVREGSPDGIGKAIGKMIGTDR